MTESAFETKDSVIFCATGARMPSKTLAGTSRIKYSPKCPRYPVMCPGRVDPLFVLKAFVKGQTGWLIAGATPETAH
jgi:F420-non-reducing hydrogenase iron-sulfur subunit